MSDEADARPLFSLDAATAADLARMPERHIACNCLSIRGKTGRPGVPNLHGEAQDESAAGWKALVDFVEVETLTRAPVFAPAVHIAWDNWTKVITLPRDIGAMNHVQEVRLYGSSLRRLPPEIGGMASLRYLDIYTSYSLHWLPYEITRCASLVDSRMSTRALYGNRNTRLPFPRLHGPIEALMPSACSICDVPLETCRRSFSGSRFGLARTMFRCSCTAVRGIVCFHCRRPRPDIIRSRTRAEAAWECLRENEKFVSRISLMTAKS